DAVLEARLGPAGGAVGSSAADGAGALRWDAAATKWLTAGRCYALLDLRTLGQAGGAEVRTHVVDATAAFLAQAGPADAPWLGRLVVEGAHGGQLSGIDALVLGLDRGLRTLEFDGMAGDRLLRANAEVGKVAPWELLGLARVGGAAFLGAGCAWWADEDRGPGDARREAGFGLRLGPTRSANTQVTRIDLTWDLDHGSGPVLTAVTRGLF
ncbi:MAG TPA: hypothetical protein PLQ13_08985, partial [Candidatus Krumholzibacteria bacterium]|nr:hypothetical protein [Candidatus Krumholzibacteria bacterium]